MPEGDTLHKVAARLRPALAGQALVRFEAPRLRGERPAPGERIDGVEARGKHLLIHFGGGLTLRTHLRMSGSWHLYRSGERWRRPRHQLRALVEADNGWLAACFAAPEVETYRRRPQGAPPPGPAAGPAAAGAGPSVAPPGDGLSGMADPGRGVVPGGSGPSGPAGGRVGAGDAGDRSLAGSGASSAGHQPSGAADPGRGVVPGGSGPSGPAGGRVGAGDPGARSAADGCEASASPAGGAGLAGGDAGRPPGPRAGGERDVHVPEALARLGPDLSEADADLDTVVARLARLDPQVEVGDALLDQRVASGIGNVYKSEACFACRLDPFTPLADVDDATRRRLYGVAHRMLRANLGPGPRRTHPVGLAVYGKPGRPCPRCGTTIRVRRQGPHARSTYWCPACQRRPA